MASSKTTPADAKGPPQWKVLVDKVAQTAAKYPPWVTAVAAFLVAAPFVIVGVIWWNTPGKPSNGRELLDLVNQKGVQEDLALTESQIQKVNDLNERQGQAQASLSTDERARQAETGVYRILDRRQGARLRQIALQVRGTRAFTDDDIMRALKLTVQQRDDIKAIQDQASKELRASFENQNRNKDNKEKQKLTEEQQKKLQEQMREKMRESRKNTEAKILEVLTPKQQSIWQDMTGDPFTGEVSRGGGGGRSRGGRS